MNITISVNRKRIPHVFVLSSLLIGYLVYDAYKKSKELPVEGPFRWIVSAAIILVLTYYAIIALIEYIKTLFDRNATLTITDTSIVDNLSIFSCGKILWDEIIDVEVRVTIVAEFLIIKVQDPSRYLENKNIVQRHVLKQFIKKTGSPIVISDQRIKYNLHELKKLLLECKNKYH